MLNEKQIKEAFGKIKQDMDFFKQELNQLNKNIVDLTHKIYEISPKNTKNHDFDISTHKPEIQTLRQLSFDTSTDDLPLEALKSPNTIISTGNRGASTDRQQTDNRHFDTQITQNQPEIPYGLDTSKQPLKNKQDSLKKATEILDSLDDIKQDIRTKFKHLTDQEFLVFSTLYQLELEGIEAEYSTLAERLNLTESSIRDYIGRLIKKGVPVEKTKLNNRKVLISISKNLKKIASLSTILQLREI